MTNWTPQRDDSLPTTRLRFGYSGLGSDPPLVRLTRVGGSTAVFEAEVKNDKGISTRSMGNEFYHHPQAATLYGKLDPQSRYEVQPVSNRSEVPVAESVSVEVQRGSENAVESFLRSDGALLHPNTREIFPADGTPSGQGTFEVDVHRCTPDAHTVRVTDATDVKTLDVETERNTGSNAGGGGSGRGGGTGAGAGGRGGSGRGGNAGSADDGAQLDEDPDASEYLEEGTPEKSFDQVVGVEGGRRIARKISRVVVPEIRRALEQKYGEIQTGSALLMYGPPGCGKTLTAEAIAYELKHRCLECGTRDCPDHHDTIEDRLGEVRFLKVKSSEISDKYAGEAPSRLNALFDRAYSIAEGDGFVVLFFDEVESILTDTSEADHNSEVETTNTFLRRAQADNLNDKDVLVVGATNFPYQMDPAALDRFSFEMFVGPPKKSDELAELWRVLTEGQEDADELDFEALGEASVGFAPRELNQHRDGIVNDIVGSKELDPTDLPSITTDDYITHLSDEGPATLNRYLSNLSDDRRELQGWEDLQDFYREWTEFLHGNDDGDDGDGADADSGDPADGADADGEATATGGVADSSDAGI